MNYRHTFVTITCLLAGSAITWAQSEPSSPNPGAATSAAPTPAPFVAPSSTWTFTPALVSQYMFRGARLGGFSFQPAVEFDAGNVALGVWSNFPLRNRVPGQSDPEIDPYGSYKIVVSDAFNIQPGFTCYYYPDAIKSNGFYRSTFEPNLALNYTVAGVVLTPKFYYDIVLHGPTCEFNASYALPLKDIGSELDFTASVGTFKWTQAAEDSIPDVKNWGDYWSAGVAVPYQIFRNQKLTVGFLYTKGSGNYLKQGTAPKTQNGAAVGRGVVTVSYAITF